MTADATRAGAGSPDSTAVGAAPGGAGAASRQPPVSNLPVSHPVADLDAEDAKLVVLARAARLRAYTPHGDPAEGAALRDTDGRTYAAATLGLGRVDLAVSALRAAVAAAVSSGARQFEAAAIVTEQDDLDVGDRAALAEFGAGIPVFLAGPDGVARTRTTS